MEYVNFLVVLCLQFPVKLSQHHHHDKTAADHLGLNYVTERILASVLPHRVQSQQQPKRDNELAADGPHIGDAPQLDESPQDIYEQELISMLEQKHGKVNTKRQSINRLLLLFCLGESESYFQFWLFCALPESFDIFNLIDSCVCSLCAFSFQNYKLFDLESCISTITLEKLCELCKHMDCWLGSGREKVVILQDRWVRLQWPHLSIKPLSPSRSLVRSFVPLKWLIRLRVQRNWIKWPAFGKRLFSIQLNFWSILIVNVN